MRNIRLLAAANLRKNRGQAISLLAFALIAALFLNIGLVLFFEYGKAFDERVEALHAPHLTIVQDRAFTTQEQIAWLEGDSRVQEVSHRDVISGMAENVMGGAQSTCVAIFSPIDEQQPMNPVTLIGDALPFGEDSIYLPFVMQSVGGYALGDAYRITLSGVELSYTVAGFTEEITFSDHLTQEYRFYISDAAYARLERDAPQHRCVLIESRMSDPLLADLVWSEYESTFYFSDAAGEIGASAPFLQGRAYAGVKEHRIFIPSIVAVMIAALALILLLVSSIVLRFGIVNNIEEGMTNIGILKAVGYSNGQIVGSILLQFGGIAAIGGLAGILISQAILPVIAELLESQSAMLWSPGFHAGLAAAAFAFAMAAVLLTALQATRRIARLHPLIALRGGLATHSFKKNAVPLETSRGPLSLLLAVKQLLRAKAQGIMILAIIAAVSFAAVVGVAVYQNVGVNTLDFVVAMVGEANDCTVVTKDPTQWESFQERLRARDGARKVFGYESVNVLSHDVNAAAMVLDDCEMLEGSMLVEGRYPKHANEAAAGANFLRQVGKEIGDTITVQHGGRSEEILITGLVQTLQNDGTVLLMTREAVTRVMPDFAYTTFFVYLEEGTSAAVFLEDLKADEEEHLAGVQDMQEMVDAQFGAYGDIFAAVAAAILLITAVVVTLTLYLVIKTMILRRRREFGIQKAVGFTTSQIMHQIALNFMPVVFLGVAAGGIGGAVGLNPLFAVLMSEIGIVRMNLPTPIGWMAATCAGVALLAYVVAMLIARRIRKISAYALVSE